MWLRKSTKFGIQLRDENGLSRWPGKFIETRIIMTRGKRAKAIWVSAVQVMLSKVIYNAVHDNCWNHRIWNISDLLPIALRKPFKVFPSDPTSESLIVTLTYFALFKEVLPCMFVISVLGKKHFNLSVGFIIGEPGNGNQTLVIKYIGCKYFLPPGLVLLVAIKPNLAKLSMMQKTRWFNC